MIEMSDDKLRWHLDNWGVWVASYETTTTGYPSRASGGMGNSGRSDFEGMCAAMDVRCARAVQAILDEIPDRERVAVHHFHVSEMFGENEAPEAERLYELGRAKVRAGLMRRGIA